MQDYEAATVRGKAGALCISSKTFSVSRMLSDHDAAFAAQLLSQDAPFPVCESTASCLE